MDELYRPVRRIPPILSALLGLAVVALAGGVLLGLARAADVGLADLVGAPGASPTRPPLAGGGPGPSTTPSPRPSPSLDPSPSPSPAPSPTPDLDPPPAAGPFEMDLYRKGDFVSQINKIYCVPAAMQTMMNIIDEGANRSAARQHELYRLARELSTDRLVGDGAEPEGWAGGLERLGYGPYAVESRGSLGAAIKAAAKAVRMTGRPAGLLTWRGAHSWVISGFKATADPAFTKDYRVTHVYIEDVWYPRISSIWGASRRPDSLVPVGALDEDYLPWRRPTARYPEKDGRFVIVIPVAEEE